jgi:hypothetical protein
MICSAFRSPHGCRRRKARRQPARDLRTFELTCGHDIMIDMPERLAEILLASA